MRGVRMLVGWMKISLRKILQQLSELSIIIQIHISLDSSCLNKFTVIILLAKKCW